MNKPKIPSILIASLIVTNAVMGVGWWRSYERAQYQTHKASTFVNLYEKSNKDIYVAPTNFAPMPNCMKDIDAKDLTYFSASAQQVSIVYRCDDKQTASSLRFYRWPLSEKPKSNDSIPFGKIQRPGLKFTIAQTFGKRSTETR
jgi:hypothetical protein